jgi:hypothetical protein
LDFSPARAVKLDIDSFEHGIQIADDLRIPKANHAIALALQPRLSIAVSFGIRGFVVMPAVQLDDESFRGAKEIHDIWSNRCLSPEMRSKRWHLLEGAP